MPYLPATILGQQVLSVNWWLGGLCERSQLHSACSGSQQTTTGQHETSAKPQMMMVLQSIAQLAHLEMLHTLAFLDLLLCSKDVSTG